MRELPEVRRSEEGALRLQFWAAWSTGWKQYGRTWYNVTDPTCVHTVAIVALSTSQPIYKYKTPHQEVYIFQFIKDRKEGIRMAMHSTSIRQYVKFSGEDHCKSGRKLVAGLNQGVHRTILHGPAYIDQRLR